MELPEVSEADVCGMGIADSQTLVLGRSVLSDATQEGKEASRGNSFASALRSNTLAFKWIRIVYRCWQDKQPYDGLKYLMALRRKGSPLVQNLALIEETQ